MHCSRSPKTKEIIFQDLDPRHGKSRLHVRVVLLNNSRSIHKMTSANKMNNINDLKKSDIVIICGISENRLIRDI